MVGYIVAAVVVVVLLLLMRTFVKSKRQYGAAANVVFAKYTYGKLNKDEQQKVHDRALEMILESGVSKRGFDNEVERYGWYAVAMDRLGMPSKVPDNPAWHKVDNPYEALPAGSFLIIGVTKFLKKHYNIDITIDPVLLDEEPDEEEEKEKQRD